MDRRQILTRIHCFIYIHNIDRSILSMSTQYVMIDSSWAILSNIDYTLNVRLTSHP